jgi:hypothetical protein
LGTGEGWGFEREMDHRLSILPTAIRGSGETNSLVVVLRAIFTWWLGDAE